MSRFFAPLLISSVLAFPAMQARAQVQRDPAALNLAKLSVQAISGNTWLTDAALQGTVNFTAGGDQESGSFTLEAKGNQESKLVLNLSGGARQEVRQQQAGVWAGADGEKHAMALHNCWTDASFLLPAFTLEAALANSQMAAVYLGQASFDGVIVDHVQFSYVVGGQSQNMTAEIQGLSAMDLYLDAVSHLPVALTFNAHPDDNLRVSIPVEIQFSGYQKFGGIQVPTRVQKLLQGTITFDIAVTGVAVNSGISDNEFATN